ncbi:MAG: molybdopterin-dependent oxidoreductase [Flavobacteriaceae bacterium]|nr:molybdopterin-dependent oxidoreductase [Flavobacteriaceae bacterium]
MNTSRRDFIKISSLGVGGAAVVGSLMPVNVFGNDKDDFNYNRPDLKRLPTYCDVCFWKCAAWAYVDEEGQIKKVIGNDDDQLSRGRLCTRGTGGLGLHFDDDRLKKPLIRVSGKGSNSEFREASWEEAIALIAKKMTEIKSKHGAESFALLKHGDIGKHLDHLFQAYGSNTIAEPAFAQCRGPRDEGLKVTFGESCGSPESTDMRDSKCLVFIGSHIGENMHNSQVQEVSEAIDKGVSIITVDPRLSTVASKSKFWLPIRPATDMALLLAWMNVIIFEELYDKEYVAKYTTGFDQLKEHVRPFTPEWAYSITDLTPKMIRDSAIEMAHAAPAVMIHPGRHVAWYGDDTQRSRAIGILNALLGSWGRRGGFYFNEKAKIPKFPAPGYPEPAWTAKDLNIGLPLAKEGVTNNVIEASLPDTQLPHKIKAWMVAATNLTYSVPTEKERMKKALEALEFLVVIDIYKVEIANYADVILPECSYLERHDALRASEFREPSVALRVPAATPRWESKPGWEIAKLIGDKLELGAYFNYKHYTEVLDWQLKEMGTTYDEMLKIGVKNLPRTSGPLYIEDGAEHTFKTPSGKIELYSKELEEFGFDPMPVFTAHEQPPVNYFRLIYGRAPMHTFSKTVNSPHLNDLRSENNLWINPRVAKIWNLKPGQEVWLKNQDEVASSFPIKVRLTERIRWDSVYMVHGFGHKDKNMTRAYGKGLNDTEMITKVMVDPLMGGTGMRGNFVTILTENPKETV